MQQLEATAKQLLEAKIEQMKQSGSSGGGGTGSGPAEVLSNEERLRVLIAEHGQIQQQLDAGDALSTMRLWYTRMSLCAVSHAGSSYR